jgi:hypothetical protein
MEGRERGRGSDSRAGVWLELLSAPCWTGGEDDIVRDDGLYGEYQPGLNRYLIPGKTENVLQGMVRWDI